MSNTITTNEWHDATQKKPWVKRMVLVRLSDGKYDVAYWCGMYWCTQCGRPYHNDGGDITHFYIFERMIPKPFEVSETKGQKQCQQCVHMYPFCSNEEKREYKYVCWLHGKRIIEEPENCKDFKKGVRP